MQINVHTHVFNFRTILTAETIVVLNNRLSGLDMPDPLRNMLLQYLRRRLRSRNKISMEDFEKTISRFRVFNRVLPDSVHSVFRKHIALPSRRDSTELLFSLLEAGITERTSESESTVGGYIDWLRIGLMTSIDKVTDDLMSYYKEDDVVVALPMDIIDQKNDPRERDIYLEQLDETKKQALRYPGRLLPFVMINTIRKGSKKIFYESVKDGACVGLKLYPSLGYSIDSDAMPEILRYCNDNELPVLMHCNDRGFRRDSHHAPLADPALWEPILTKLDKLKICFAHFGGDEQNGEAIWNHHPLPENSWPAKILEMMNTFKGRVFADISFHATYLNKPDTKKNYRKNLREIIGDKKTGSQVLWGTDYHLLRQRITDSGFADEFRELLGEDHFRKISVDNPAAFLGLPVNGNPEGGNIRRHIEWLVENRAGTVQGRPPNWLLEHTTEKSDAFRNWILSAGKPWDPNNLIHITLFNFLWNSKPTPLASGIKRTLRKAHNNDPRAIFEAVGRLPVAELALHNKVLGRGSTRRSLTAGFCTDLEEWFDHFKKLERDNNDSAKFRRNITEVCEDKKLRISNLAGVLESFYSVPSEIEM